MSITSNQTYSQVREHLPEKRRLVYDAIKEMKSCTFYDVANYLRLEINQVSNRFNELLFAGYIKVIGSEKNGIYERDLYTIIENKSEIIKTQEKLYQGYVDSKSELEQDFHRCQTNEGKNLLRKRINHLKTKINNLKEIAI
ncbi:hypothetical protein ATE49_15425 [Elizabethkingia miricola]|uniref:Transcriptional regulator n=1 Tax=Elizabethkingia miricola TaxID=172045 RepID=A0ABY3NAA1_ELIMR|nr:hypothetical protein [Elizabethkingia miricola]MDV3585580.1 hypothetical protein [Elizabethkingia anophelis]MDV3786206.1 hypothetical protein [Elizabethkingia anophelis]OBS12807.1 hypothetical protein ATE49_15425 [Elizabethkingia miricola]TYO83596.1 hypothetical protein LX74_04066 [Elizabethkingia miricola]